MKLTVQQFLVLLERVDAVSVDEGPILTSWVIHPISGEADNEVVCFSWTDGEYEYIYKLTEDAITNGYFNEYNTFICSEDVEEYTSIRFYTLTRITPII